VPGLSEQRILPIGKFNSIRSSVQNVDFAKIKEKNLRINEMK